MSTKHIVVNNRKEALELMLQQHDIYTGAAMAGDMNAMSRAWSVMEQVNTAIRREIRQIRLVDPSGNPITTNAPIKAKDLN